MNQTIHNNTGPIETERLLYVPKSSKFKNSEFLNVVFNLHDVIFNLFDQVLSH